MHQFHYKTILQNKLWLIQTDTTVGFLSQDAALLARIKERPPVKPFVQVAGTFKALKTLTRIPKKYANQIRRAKKTTFVYPNNKAIRVVKDEKHAKFIKPYKWFYSTSANEKSLSYEKEFAFATSDIIVEDNKGLFEGESSRIFLLGPHKMKRLR